MGVEGDLGARANGVEALGGEAKAGATHRVNLLAAVWACIRLGQKPGGQERAKAEVQVREALLAEVLDAPAQGSKPRPPHGEKRCAHDKYLYLSQLDSQLKMTP